ncbi:MAG: hypothetical protein V5A45_13640 [Haloarculaceae archaeon]
MVALPTDRIPIRGMAIGALILLSGTITATLVKDPILPALVAATVLLIFLLVENRYESEE